MFLALRRLKPVSDVCPKCGAGRKERHPLYEDGVLYDCLSDRDPSGAFGQSAQCLRNQLAQAQERIAGLERVAEAGRRVLPTIEEAVGEVYEWPEYEALRDALTALEGDGE